jgi:hypothetical protein
METPQNGGVLELGQLLLFRKGIVHTLPEMYEEPIVFLSVDTPRREPRDIIFENPVMELQRVLSVLCEAEGFPGSLGSCVGLNHCFWDLSHTAGRLRITRCR